MFINPMAIPIFTRVFLPNTAPGILSGCLLVLIPTMTLFYIPNVLGGARFILLGNLIQNARALIVRTDSNKLFVPLPIYPRRFSNCFDLKTYSYKASLVFGFLEVWQPECML